MCHYGRNMLKTKCFWHSIITVINTTNTVELIVIPLTVMALFPWSTFPNSCFWPTNEPRHDKTKKMSVRQAQTQINLGICPVWSEFLLSAWRNLGSKSTHWVHSKDSDQTGWMPRLIWVVTGRTLILLVSLCHGSNNLLLRFPLILCWKCFHYYNCKIWYKINHLAKQWIWFSKLFSIQEFS